MCHSTRTAGLLDRRDERINAFGSPVTSFAVMAVMAVVFLGLVVEIA